MEGWKRRETVAQDLRWIHIPQNTYFKADSGDNNSQQRKEVLPIDTTGKYRVNLCDIQPSVDLMTIWMKWSKTKKKAPHWPH